MRHQLIFLLVLPLIVSGCAVKTAQRTVQTGLTAVAEAIDEVDVFVDEQMPLAAARAREESTSYDEYRAAMHPWLQVLQALEGSMASVQVAQEALDVWVSTGVLPDAWGSFCAELGALLDRVASFLPTVGVDVPSAVGEATPYVSVVCGTIADWVEGDD